MPAPIDAGGAQPPPAADANGGRATDLPHDGVWARLGVSAIHGVGVFAIRAIAAGTDVFANDRGAIVWIDVDAIAALPPALARLYEDFAIRDGRRRGCPANFNSITVGWYVNQPAAGEAANLRIGDDHAMIADRAVAAGEELTIVYESFSR